MIYNLAAIQTNPPEVLLGTIGMLLNPLDHTICLEMPSRRIPSTWIQHTPFAMFLVEILRPKLIVELGTFQGVSYCAFCQAVAKLKLDTKCYGVDTWEGDPHTGFYGQEVLLDLQGHHALRYGEFSNLIQGTFDDAKANFEDGTIDLLHIDGYHTYEAAQHDFGNWLQKVSDRGIVLLHDIHVYERDFGVWKFWEELKARYPTFEVEYGCGLGVVAVGNKIPEPIRPLFYSQEEEIQKIREFFHLLGERVEQDITTVHILQNQVNSVQQTVLNQQAHIDHLQSQIGRTILLQQSLGYRLISKYHRAVDRFLPPDTHRRRLYDAVKHAIIRTLRFTWNIFSKRRRSPSVEDKNLQSATGNEIANVTAPQIRDQEVDTKSGPMISVVIPVYNTVIQYLDAAIRSVRNQTYTNWELCICDDGSSRSETIEYLNQILDEIDPRIHIVFSNKNEGISHATNKAIGLAHGDYLAFLDHDDELTPTALEEVVRALIEHQDLDIIYSDQDKVDSGQNLSEPFYKPDWSPEYFRHVMYVGHLLVVHRRIINQAGGFDSKYNGVQDYEFILRASEISDHIHHIPKILYHWRKIPGSVAMGVEEKGDIIGKLQVRAVNEHLERMGISAFASPHPLHPHRVVIAPSPREIYPLVSIVIPIKDYSITLERCINSIMDQSTYPNFEIVIVSDESSPNVIPPSLKNIKIRAVTAEDKLNLSQKLNRGIQSANGDFIVTLNNQIKISASDWLQTLLLYFDFRDVGVVAPLLLYPDGTVYHAGLVLGLRDAVDYVMRGYQYDQDGYAGSLSCPREVSAVSMDCMMFRLEDFKQVGGFDEYFNTSHQDVDFCLRLRKQQKRILYVPDVPLTKYELKDDNLDEALLVDTWSAWIKEGDPYYNPNFSRKFRDYELN